MEKIGKLSFIEELKEKKLWVEFGLSPQFYCLKKEEKIIIFEKALKDYKKTCCLKSSIVRPDKAHYFGEMCQSCTVTAQILLYGYIHNFNKNSKFSNVLFNCSFDIREIHSIMAALKYAKERDHNDERRQNYSEIIHKFQALII